MILLVIAMVTITMICNGNNNDDLEVSHAVLNGDDTDDVDNDSFHNCSTNDMDSVADTVRYIEYYGASQGTISSILNRLSGHYEHSYVL